MNMPGGQGSGSAGPGREKIAVLTNIHCTVDTHVLIGSDDIESGSAFFVTSVNVTQTPEPRVREDESI